MLALALIGAFPGVAHSESESAPENELSRVNYHTEELNTQADRSLRDHVAAAWEAMKPYAAEHGLSEFPQSHIWGLADRQSAAQVSGISPAIWEGFSGWASGNSAWVVVPEVAAHEAVHMVQTALGGSNWGSHCIAEGAAEWYQARAREILELQPVDETLANRMEAFGDTWIEHVDLSAQEWTAMGMTTTISEERWAELEERFRLPLLTELHDRDHYLSAHDTFGSTIYSQCLFGFDLLIRTGGGEAAYFNYLSQLRSVDWPTAFDNAFVEDLATFETRFARYQETGFVDHRLEHEIQRERFFLLHVTDCEPSSRSFCIG